MNNSGIIYEISENNAILHTCHNDFVIIEAKPGIRVGQVVEYSEADIINPEKVLKFAPLSTAKHAPLSTGKYAPLTAAKFAPLATGLAAAFIFVILYFNRAGFLFSSNDTYAYIDVDINPSIELTINSKAQVLDAKPINEDAKDILSEIDLKGMEVDDALTRVVEESKNSGYIKPQEETIVLVAGALNDGNAMVKEDKPKNEKHLDNVLKEIKEKINTPENEEVVKTVRALSTTVKEAKENNTSIGKVVLYKKAKEIGMDVTLEEIISKNVSEFKELIDNNSQGDTDIIEIGPTAEPTAEPTDEPTEVAVDTATPVPTPNPTTETSILPTGLPTHTPVPTKLTNTPTEKKTKVTPKPVNIVINTPTKEFKPTPVVTPKPTPVGLVDDRYKNIVYSGNWKKINDSNYLCSTVSRTASAGDYVQYTFTGTSVDWYGAIGKQYGVADVYVDGVLDASVDCYSNDTTVIKAKIYQKAGLTPGQHTIKIVVKSEINTSTTNSFIDIDAFRVR